MFSPKKSLFSLLALTCILSAATPDFAAARAPLTSKPNCFNLLADAIAARKIIDAGAQQSSVASSKSSTTPQRVVRTRKPLSSSAGAIVTVGVTLKNNGAAFYISSVVPGSAADQSGLLPGDEIHQLNGLDIGNRFSVAGLMDALNGPEGSSVTLEIARQKDGGYMKKTLVRKKAIVFSDTETSIDADSIGYVRIRTLSPSVAATIRTWFASDAVKHAKGVVLDLRTNPIGDMASLLSILSNVVSQGTSAGSILSASMGIPLKTGDSPSVRPRTVVLLNEGGILGAIVRYVVTIKTLPAIPVIVEGESRGKNVIAPDELSFTAYIGAETPVSYCADSENFTWDLPYKTDIPVKPENGKDAPLERAKAMLTK